MLDHHIQRTIVYTLALSSGLRFGELKPAELENKLFDYHLKKVVAAGYAEKTADGIYQLTPEGRRLGVHVLQNTQALVDRAYSVLFLLIRRAGDGAWLLYKRNNHPLLGGVGFMHATPNSEEPIATTAQKACRERTGIEAQFKVLGSGYFRVFRNHELESFTNFSLLVCEDATGELAQNDPLAEYFWVDTVDESRDDWLPTMPTLLDRYAEGELFFTEQTIMLED